MKNQSKKTYRVYDASVKNYVMEVEATSQSAAVKAAKEKYGKEGYVFKGGMTTAKRHKTKFYAVLQN